MLDEVLCSALCCVDLIFKIRPQVRQTGKCCYWEFSEMISLVMIF